MELGDTERTALTHCALAIVKQDVHANLSSLQAIWVSQRDRAFEFLVSEVARLSMGRMVLRAADWALTTVPIDGRHVLFYVLLCPAKFAKVMIEKELPDSAIFAIRPTPQGLKRCPWATKEQIAANRKHQGDRQLAETARQEARKLGDERLRQLRHKLLQYKAPEDRSGALKILLGSSPDGFNFDDALAALQLLGWPMATFDKL